MMGSFARGMFVVVAACAAALLFPSTVDAAVYGAPAPNTGTLTVADGELSHDEDGDWDDVEIDWDISNNGDGTLHYEYTFTGFNKPAVSHFTLDVSDDGIDYDSDPNMQVDDLIRNAEITYDGTTDDIQSLSEFGDFEGITGAVKFDEGDPEVDEEPAAILTYSFDSERLPVFGDFAVKGGTSTLTNNVTDNHYIARPNGMAAIPLPAAVWPGLVMLGGVVMGRRRQRRTA